MSRDNIVSVRLTDDELVALREMGRPSEVLRQLLRDEIRAKTRPATNWPYFGQASVTSSGRITTNSFAWYDGTVGPNWPATA